MQKLSTGKFHVEPPLHHSITSSARLSRIGGTSRPIAFAVFRLIASSNFVGCSMGKSLGFWPCKILCTNFAPCRNNAGPSAPYDIKPPASAKARVVEAAGNRCSRARFAMRSVGQAALNDNSVGLTFRHGRKGSIEVIIRPSKRDWLNLDAGNTPRTCDVIENQLRKERIGRVGENGYAPNSGQHVAK